jgi:hypothetical protein
MPLTSEASPKRRLQREAENYKNDTESASQQVFQRVAQKVYSFVQVYAKQHGYTIVIERGSDSTPVVWYVASNVDITDQVVKAYNAKAGTPTAGPTIGLIPRIPPSVHPILCHRVHYRIRSEERLSSISGCHSCLMSALACYQQLRSNFRIAG